MTSAPQTPTKRTRLDAPSAVAAAVAAEVIVAERALLELIASFIPLDSEQIGASRSEAVLETIKSLCNAIPTFSRLVGPSNEAFWRAMVLNHFDFSTTLEAFNVEDFNGVWGEIVPTVFSSANVPDEDSDAEVWDGDEWEEDGPYQFLSPHDGMTPQEWTDKCYARSTAARHAWIETDRMSENSGVFFEENYAWWSSFGAYFRPSQFAFLQKIQIDRSLISTEWPEHEPAFSLFCDLVVLQKLVRPSDDRFQTYSDGEELLTPCLLSRFDGDPTEQRHKMMRHCGILPPYWNSGRPGVSCRWAGLDGPIPTVDMADVTVDMRWDPDRGAYASKEECAVFPRCSIPEFMKLRRLAYDSFDDWRRVHVNRGEYNGPELYIGRSKQSSRWIGLIGQSQYEAYD